METIGAIKGKSNVICFYIFRKSEKSYLQKVIFKKVTKKTYSQGFSLMFLSRICSELSKWFRRMLINFSQRKETMPQNYRR